MKIYTTNEVTQELLHLSHWQFNKDAIEKTFLFGDFKQALGFIVQVGILAEKADHHPEIINVYNKVILRLNTHSANAITSKDILLAKAIETIPKN